MYANERWVLNSTCSLINEGIYFTFAAINTHTHTHSNFLFSLQGKLSFMVGILIYGSFWAMETYNCHHEALLISSLSATLPPSLGVTPGEEYFFIINPHNICSEDEERITSDSSLLTRFSILWEILLSNSDQRAL